MSNAVLDVESVEVESAVTQPEFAEVFAKFVNLYKPANKPNLNKAGYLLRENIHDTTETKQAILNEVAKWFEDLEAAIQLLMACPNHLTVHDRETGQDFNAQRVLETFANNSAENKRICNRLAKSLSA